MKFAEFAERVDLATKEEFLKAQHIAYFLLKEQNKTEFTLGDILDLLGELPVHQPNRTRLRKKMLDSGDFPRVPKSNSLRLHAGTVATYDRAYSQLWPSRPTVKRGGIDFVHPERISELRELVGHRPDVSRLIRLCEEINTCHHAQCIMAVALLARTVINHVPPALGFKTFSEVANNYGGDPKTHKSFKQIASKLDGAARTIGDMIAHQTMRPVESLPTPAQIDFTQEFDVLLAEVARVIRERNA